MSIKAHKVGLVVIADWFTRQIANFVGVDKCVYPTSSSDSQNRLAGKNSC